MSSDVQTAYLSGNIFSEVLVLTPAQPTVRLPECFNVDNSRAPTFNFADYPLRVDGITIKEPRFDPRFTLLAERFIHNNDTLSEKRKELDLKKLQHPNLELKIEVKIRFQGLNPHPVFQVAQVENKTTPAPFIVTYVDFNRDHTLPDLTYGKIMLQPFFRPQTHYIILKHKCSQAIYNSSFTPFFVTFHVVIQCLLNLQIQIIIFLQMIQILQIVWFLTVIAKNNII